MEKHSLQNGLHKNSILFLDEKPGSVKVNDLRCLVMKTITLTKRYVTYVPCPNAAEALFLRR
jgi:hypothetical protein